MEVLLILVALLGLAFLVLSVALTARLWSTLGMHRQAMHALHQELSQRNLARRMRHDREAEYQAASTEPSSSPHSIWRTGPGTGI